ncbi:MAG TPA: Wzz/FepE/Etk N-terminal domain-containing protein [Terracidiphilus sp.]|nr:Wzz/FepE/Etk N-terminal domain-containing protein [Terracidiphilus sp.]
MPQSEGGKPDESPLGAEASQQTSSDADEISLLDICIVLVRRKRVIYWCTGAAAVVSILVSLLLPKRYTATVTLLPPQQNSSMGSALMSQIDGLGGIAALAGSSLGIKNPNDMYVSMMKSRVVEDAMIQKYGLMKQYRKKYLSDARKTFEHRATVDGSGKDGLIRISVEDKDPRRAAEMANGYVDQFRTLSEHLAITEASQRRLFFEGQLEKAKDNLAHAEEALKQTEQKTGLIQLDSQARALIESAASLRAQITAKEVQIQGMQTYATNENSQLVQAQQELDGLRAQLARLGGSEDSADSLIVPKGKVPQAGLEYVRKLRDVKYYETIFDILARQFELAKLDEAKEGALIQVVDPAIPPDKRSSPKRALIVLISTFAGFLIGVFAALIQEGFRQASTDPETRDKLAYIRAAFTPRRARA